MRVVSICLLVGVVLIALPAGAGAQSIPSDPEADSPSGVVYELPVDRARKDAAPQRGASQRGGNPAGGTDATAQDELSIRSENRFGTSSRVPGVSPERGARTGSERDDDGGDGGEGRSGDSGGGPGSDFSRLAPSSVASPPDGPSDTVVFLLLGALLAVGAAIGLVVGRRAARDKRG